MLGVWQKTQPPHRTDFETQCFAKKQPQPQTILWLPQNNFAHIKREKTKPSQIFNLRFFRGKLLFWFGF
jgi:hypothetical protein